MNILDWFKTLLMPTRPLVGGVGGADDRSLPAAEGSAELAGLDFQAAIRVHHEWKQHLDELLQGQERDTLDPVTVCRDDLCELGQWIYGEGRRVFGHLPLFEELRVSHADFHLVAGEVVHGVRAGRVEHARQLMAEDYQRTSQQVQALLAGIFLEHHQPR
ncbi:MAG: hypothetical protein RLZZ584_1886 [Pseudomonadota bacterium]|jgi:hypothetical protein